MSAAADRRRACYIERAALYAVDCDPDRIARIVAMVTGAPDRHGLRVVPTLRTLPEYLATLPVAEPRETIGAATVATAYRAPEQIPAFESWKVHGKGATSRGELRMSRTEAFESWVHDHGGEAERAYYAACERAAGAIPDETEEDYAARQRAYAA